MACREKTQLLYDCGTAPELEGGLRKGSQVREEGE